jgi:pyruvate/2-oxoglutarate dehydrogenase complex dihydrolipoamide acyltransferase (E2) component
VFRKELLQVSEERRSQSAMDPTQLWRQWFETSTRMWSGVFGAGHENLLDPHRLYRQWLNGLEELQQQMLGALGGTPALTNGSRPALGDSTPNNPVSAKNPAASANPAAAQSPVADAAAGQVAEAQNLWKQWFEANQEFWQKAAKVGEETVDLAPRWFAMLDQIRNNLLSAEGYPTDPLQFSTRWYNATSGPLSDFVGDLIEREEILDVSSQFLQNYASFYKVFRRNSEDYLKGLSLPVRSDVTRVAGLVVALEDKVDRLEEAFEDFEYGYASPATAESVQSIEERIGRLEDSLGRIEGDASDDSTSSLEKRLDDVEGKLDQILTALQNAPQNGSAQASIQAEAAQEDGADEIAATAAARRKARELGVDLAEVEGTGLDGQITVDDVRRKGAS